MRLIRPTLMTTTDAAARKHQYKSLGEERRGNQLLMVTHARIASEALVKEEQYGVIKRLPDWSAKRTTLPKLPVPNSNPINEASISKMKFAKYRDSRTLHNMGTVVASRMTAPRRRDEGGSVNTRT